MGYRSTSKNAPVVSLKEAVLRGLAPDGGLYFPETIPTFSGGELSRLRKRPFIEAAHAAAKLLVGDELPAADLARSVEQAFDFPVPLVNVSGEMHSLELFHGPTLAFKDFGARFMAQLMSRYAADERGGITILVATSGDTGGAVAAAFHNTPGIEVYILYPKGRVSPLQEKQLTTLGGNIHALRVAGSFDDCQRVAKAAFLDPAISSRRRLASANSINIARLIPQSFYYLYAALQFSEGQAPIVAVPSGNFGNLTAALIAKRMGAPIAHFLAATNRNDVVPQYLGSGVFTPRPSVATISNAMDVGNPSNFARMLELFGGSHAAMSREISGLAFTDDETREIIARAWKTHKYLLDPHGAVAFGALETYLDVVKKPLPGIFVETAHPGKFMETVEPLVGAAAQVPERLARLAAVEGRCTDIEPSLEALKAAIP